MRKAQFQHLTQRVYLQLALFGAGWACGSAPVSTTESAREAAAPSPSASSRPQDESLRQASPEALAPTPSAAPTQTAPAVSATEPSQVATQVSPSDTPMLNALTKAINDSPYSAIVQHTQVKLQRDGESGDKHIRHARVLETLRGPKMDKITYSVFTESGESAEPPKGPVIVTLCRDADGLYWPGVGSSFPADKHTADVGKTASASANKDQTVFSNCD
jgi:hypothetical protein